MKNLLITAGLILFATHAMANDIQCKLEDSQYWAKGTVVVFHVNPTTNKAQIEVTKGELLYELGDLDPQLTLISKGKISNLNWNVSTYFGFNHDDTQFLFTIAQSPDVSSVRVNIQVLVDGLEGGSHSHSLECEPLQ